MKLTRRNLLSGAIAAAAVFNTDLPLLSATAALSPVQPDLAGDPGRPQYHLVPRSNWINDPNGPIYWNGMYHMFYQANPTGNFIGTMVWGHAISPDMVHWRHLPAALTPTPGGPDANGCWTGTCVIQDGVVHAMYTGVANSPESAATVHSGTQGLRERQCLAWSKDPELRTWTKFPAAVIDAPPAEFKVQGFRDPSPWRQGEYWYLIVGSGLKHQGGMLLLYRSRDLRHWEYLHVAAASTPEDAAKYGDMWECPELFPLGGGKHMLIYSTWGYAHWEIGTFDPTELKFHSEQKGLLGYGAYYAPKTQLDRSGNRIVWGWVQETRPETEYKRAGWAGMMSLPRVLSLGNEGHLQMHFAHEIQALRSSHVQLQVTANEQTNQRQIGALQMKNGCGEVLCRVRTGTAPFTLSLFSHGEPNRWLPIDIHYDPAIGHQITAGNHIIPLERKSDGTLEIHLYVDGSVAEILLNNQAACTKRFYTPDATAPVLGVRFAGSTIEIEQLSVWQLDPISADRLTT